MNYSDEFRAEVLSALRAVQMIGPVARAFRVAQSSVRKWARAARVKLPPARERQRRGARQGSAAAAEVRWPGWQRRRARAAELRAAGKSLAEIAATVGYRGESGALYALRGAGRKEDGTC